MRLSWSTLVRLAVSIVVLTGLAGCSGGDPDVHQPTFKSVDILGNAFTPNSVEVQQGDSVLFLNKDKVSHAVKLDSGERETGMIPAGGRAAITLPTTGTFRYHCTIHPSMTGLIVVKDA